MEKPERLFRCAHAEARSTGTEKPLVARREAPRIRKECAHEERRSRRLARHTSIVRGAEREGGLPGPQTIRAAKRWLMACRVEAPNEGELFDN